MRYLLSLILCFGVLWFTGTFTSCSYDQHLPEEEVVIVDTVYFQADIMPIFNASCNSAGCHTTGAVPPDLSPGRAYNELISGGYINVENPDASELLKWMRGEGDIPMPLTGPDVEYNSLVLSWISQGALNN